MASVVAFITIYFFSHEHRLKTFYHLGFILETDHLLLGSKLTEYGIRADIEQVQNKKRLYTLP